MDASNPLDLVVVCPAQFVCFNIPVLVFCSFVPRCCVICTIKKYSENWGSTFVV